VPQRPHAVPEGLAAALERIHHRHVLVDDPVVATDNLALIRRALGEWERDGPGPLASPGVRPSPLAEDLDRLAYHHLLVDDRRAVARTLRTIGSEVRNWSVDLRSPERSLERPADPRELVTGPDAALPLERGLVVDL
jgi:hypothetical protein